MAVTTRPAAIPLPEAAAFPPELVALPNWTAYDLEEREPGQFTKMPYNPHHPGRRAKSNDPTTWGTFGQARAFAASRGMGVMLMLAPPLFGFDLDDCYDGDELSPLAVSVLGEIDTYTERSVSGKGVKGVGYGKKPGTRCRRKGLKLEIYDHARPFALTGHRLPDAPLAINDCQDGLDFIHGAAFGEEQATPAVAWNPAAVTADDDRAVIDWLHSYRNAGKFIAYWTMQDGGDPSGGDQGMANIIAWRVGPDPARIEAIFNASARAARPKWQQRAAYREGTIRKAIERCNGRFYEVRPLPPTTATFPPAVAGEIRVSPEVQNRVAELERENADLRARLERSQRSLANFMQIRRNPAIKAERDTLAAVAVDLIARTHAGEADAEGYVRQPASRIADAAGKSVQVVRTHRRRGEEWGLWDGKLVEERDPETGARRTAYYVRAKDEPEKILDVLVTLTPEREAKEWGGKREPCPRCGSTATRTVTYCAGCDLILKETRHDGDPEDAPITAADLRADLAADEPAADAPSVPPTPVEVLAAYPQPVATDLATAPAAPVASDHAAYLAERDEEEADDWDELECNAPGCTRRAIIDQRFCGLHRHLRLDPPPRPVRPPVPPERAPDPPPEPPRLAEDLAREKAGRTDAATIAETLRDYQRRWDAGERGVALGFLIADCRAVAAARAVLDAEACALAGGA